MRTRGALLGILCLLWLAGCASPAPSQPAYAPSPVDEINHQEAKRLVEEQTNCFKREAQSKALAKIDLETAALSVQARCVAETQRFKAFSAAHTIESVPTFEARMRRMEADDLQFIKQVLALVRTASPQPGRK